MDLKTDLLSAIDQDLRTFIQNECPEDLTQFSEMIEWHMGWSSSVREQLIGKRLRPLLLLLMTQISGGRWQDALPAATAVELIHNFTLIHDDIQDNSDTRHNRFTLWKKYGVPQAINTGDSLHSLGNISASRLIKNYPSSTVFEITHLIERTVFQLTIGQYQDMAFQARVNISKSDYLSMIRGKTAALLSACFEIGYLLGHKKSPDREKVRQIGNNLGIAFQIQDDHLGIWGKPKVTGKSDLSDLRSRKVTFPIVLSLSDDRKFRELWESHKTEDNTLLKMKLVLEANGSDQLSKDISRQYLEKAIKDLHSITGKNDDYSNLLFGLIQNLFDRVS